MKLELDYKHSEFWAVLVVVGGGGALALTLALEHVFNLEPCSLCLSQRYMLFLGVLVAIIGLATDSRLGILPLLSSLFFVGGIGFALWHLYVIFGPDNSISCLAGANALIRDGYPFADIIEALFAGSPDCAQSAPAIPLLALVAFVVLIGSTIRQFQLGPRSTY